MTYLLDDYDTALVKILEEGVQKKNRTGVDSLAVFCIQSRYEIGDYFPLLTRRKIWPKAVFAELLWFISGSTNNNDLKKLGADFWTPWVDEEFEKKHGYAPGSLGPVYGFQLRHFGGEYGDGTPGKVFSKPTPPLSRPGNYYKTCYGAGGFDQLAWMIKQLKVNPDSRRNLFSLWNPKQIDMMRLAPCHYTFQVFVYEDNLSGVLTQRSCDFPVGVPYNICFYSALLYMLAQQTGLKPYEFVHNTIDSHIYVDQIEAVEEYLSRPQLDCPKLELEPAPDIDSYTIDNFKITDYNPQPIIKIPVAV